MPQLSPLQMTDSQSWAGLTTVNHLGAIYQSQPQKASNLITKIHQTNFGMDLDGYLSQFGVKELETDDDFTWDLVGSGKKNVPLVQAEINGTAVVVTDTPGLNFTEFTMVFPEFWFTDENIIVGHKNEKYPLQIQADPIPTGTNWAYRVKLITADPDLFVPVDELAAGTRWSKDWSLVEQTLSKKGGGIHFTSPFSMRNAFSMIRMQKTTPGNMKDRPLVSAIQGSDGKYYKVWTQYEDFIFDQEFREEKNKLLMFATSNRDANGNYFNFGKSGYVKKQGAGIRQQMESANTSFYSTFSIDLLLNILLDLSEGKLPSDKRKFVLMTGERGAVQFHKALEDHAQLFVPLQNTSRMYSASMKGVSMGYGYGGQFVEYRGPQGIEVSLMVNSLYDDRERNKIYHPDGGVAESYRYDILDVGTSDGEPNIQKVMVKGQSDIYGYIAGLRDPFQLGGKPSRMMSMSTDGYEMHRGAILGAMVKDPSRTASLIPAILA